METRDCVQQIMSEVGPLLEIDEIQEAEDGLAWLLAIEEGFAVLAELDEENERLILSAEIGAPQEAKRTRLYEMLLVYNAQWTQTGGIRMVLDEPGGQVVQMFDLAASNLEVSRLARILVNFVEIGLGWRQIVTESSGQPSESADPPESVGTNGLRV